MPSNSELIDLAARLADCAAQHSLGCFRTSLDIEIKADASPVTLADRGAEAAMRRLLNDTVPTHGILGEEHGRERLDADLVWVLDPIDGTKSFITGSPLWGTLIAAVHRGRVGLGMIDMPVLRERWLGLPGEGATCNGRKVRTSGCIELAHARIITTSPDAFDADEWLAYDALSRRCAMRRFGGDCYAYAQLAGGHVDLVAECGLQPYDYMALVGVVEGAGSVITDWQGRPLTVESDGRVLAAATAALHRQALEFTARYRPQARVAMESSKPAPQPLPVQSAL
ncbi:histidinol-phosphatase [Variovorax sp. Sphag1AA]|uniref:histidinol-phosphatase n=1 Tax=Variovorax sp. Sphag1AA TaxID=2587027 RepID=UPI00160F3C49|nr:histidinol-phosphatase [Variovorax sp. Sphag1AA]MBB3180878.1 myo-inositol-1(or 4)-monophosphatase [Variovorax sp. Sphag1AA]